MTLSNVINVRGRIKVFNTINEFNSLNKNQILDELGESIWNEIQNERAVDDPRLLTTFLLINFANLKSYVFHYWFAFPAIIFPGKNYYLRDTKHLHELIQQQEKITLFLGNLKSFQLNNQQMPFFCVDQDTLEVLKLRDGLNRSNNENKRILFAFYDPNTHTNHPGWPLRNYLALLNVKWFETYF